jgi:hypothetical protein
MSKNRQIISGSDFIEELVFQIDSDWVEHYADAEGRIMAVPLSKQPGFVAWQIETDEENPADVRSIYYWTSEEAYRNLDQEWLGGLKKEIGEALPQDKVRFVEARHATKTRRRIRRLVLPDDYGPEVDSNGDKEN